MTTETKIACGVIPVYAALTHWLSLSESTTDGSVSTSRMWTLHTINDVNLTASIIRKAWKEVINARVLTRDDAITKFIYMTSCLPSSRRTSALLEDTAVDTDDGSSHHYSDFLDAVLSSISEILATRLTQGQGIELASDSFNAIALQIHSEWSDKFNSSEAAYNNERQMVAKQGDPLERNILEGSIVDLSGPVAELYRKYLHLAAQEQIETDHIIIPWNAVSTLSELSRDKLYCPPEYEYDMESDYNDSRVCASYRRWRCSLRSGEPTSAPSGALLPVEGGLSVSGENWLIYETNPLDREESDRLQELVADTLAEKIYRDTNIWRLEKKSIRQGILDEFKHVRDALMSFIHLMKSIMYISKQEIYVIYSENIIYSMPLDLVGDSSDPKESVIGIPANGVRYAIGIECLPEDIASAQNDSAFQHYIPTYAVSAEMALRIRDITRRLSEPHGGDFWDDLREGLPLPIDSVGSQIGKIEEVFWFPF